MAGSPKRSDDDRPLTAYERWELPLLDAQGNELPREEEREVKPLTAADLEKLAEEARQEGLEEGRKAGREEGYKAGFQQGLEEGREKGRNEGHSEGEAKALEETKSARQQEIERLQALMIALLEPIESQQEELEASLVTIAVNLARAVIYRELSVDTSQISAVVRDALASLPRVSDNLTIFVHPSDTEHAREAVSRIQREVHLEEDPELVPGGARVRTNQSLVDFTVEKRFQKVVQQLLDNRIHAEAVGEGAAPEHSMSDLTDFQADVLSEPSEQAADQPDQEPEENSGKTPQQ